MADRLLIVDSDVFILLSAAGLLYRVAELLKVSAGNIRRLAALPHQLSRGRNFAKNYPRPLRDAALAECNNITPLTERPDDDELLDRLNEVEDIDEGEALLIALAVENPVYYLASGDKRALVALATAPALQSAREALSGRIVCLEAILRLLVKSDGVTSVATAFAPVRNVNKTLRVIFSEAAATDQTQCLQYIDSYWNDMIKTIGAELLHKPW